ncbi:hypothetical protein F5148DRAFT_1378312 [Russula earlei]|uniref:Uncharacterized protein n=1 Tax=Russula earlei TaxID=71964 RepID=A0ACC0TZ26_9AGAM|nr:hypothetical protein F5148DRAFT_1378312 [Russula earlei]
MAGAHMLIYQSHTNLLPGFLSKSTQNHPHLEISDSPAPEATLGLLHEHAARSVTYVSLGPLTNLVRMLRTDGACVRERIGHVVFIGGALDVPRDATPSAEYSYAVDEMSISPTTRLPPTRVLLLPLYVTSAHLLLFHGYATRVDPALTADKLSVPTTKTPVTHFTSAFLRRTRSVMRGITELTSGMCVVDKRDDQKVHAPGANRAHVDMELKKRMVAGSAETGDLGSLESVVVPAVEDEPSRPWKDEQEGIPVVEGTPGTEALLQIMLKRLWHVEVNKEGLTADLLQV